MSIFPQDVEMDVVIAQDVQDDTELPLLKEYAWDFEKNDFITENGKNVILEGIDAIPMWVYKVLKTTRYKFLAYTWDYGNELENLVGVRSSREFVQSEAERYLKDCLLINPYINYLTDITTTIEGRSLTVSFVVDSVYGEVSVSV